MNPAGSCHTPEDAEALLVQLDEVDQAVRALYRELADEPDLATKHADRLRELHANRLELAQRVGLASLARWRAAKPHVGTTPAATLAALTGPATIGPEDPERPSLPPASDAQVAQWKSKVRSAGLGLRLSDATSEGSASLLILHELMSALGPPRELASNVNVVEELDALDAVSSDERQAQWARLPKNAQQLWLSLLVARCRALKELPSAAPWIRVKEILARFPPWAKNHAPGHVNGMQVRHGPMRGSWAQDATDYWGELGDLLGETLVAFQSDGPKKRPKRAASDDEQDPDVDPAWRVFPLVRGRRALLVGGDPREPNRERLERAFLLASLDWPAIDGPRKVDATVASIRRHGYDLVLVLGPFVTHAQSSAIIEAAKETDVPWALADGYGTAAVRLALERFLGGPRAEASTG